MLYSDHIYIICVCVCVWHQWLLLTGCWSVQFWHHGLHMYLTRMDISHPPTTTFWQSEKHTQGQTQSLTLAAAVRLNLCLSLINMATLSNPVCKIFLNSLITCCGLCQNFIVHIKWNNQIFSAKYISTPSTSTKTKCRTFLGLFLFLYVELNQSLVLLSVERRCAAKVERHNKIRGLNVWLFKTFTKGKKCCCFF